MELEKYNKPPSLYDEIAMPALNTHALKDIIVDELLREAYTPEDKLSTFDGEVREHRQQLNSRIEKAWARRHKTLFIYSKPVSVFAHGAPGHGKTTSFRVAAKEFCELVGMNFIDRPNIDFKPSRDDFLFIVQEMAGETSSVTVGGFVTKHESEDGKHSMVKVIDRRLQFAEDAGFSLLLFDDGKNTTESVQNVYMPIIEEHAIQGNSLGHVAVGLTGNIGIDGTNIRKVSSANMTRSQSYLVYDTIANFASRSIESQKNTHWENNVDIGTDSVISFLKLNTDLFTETPKRREARTDETFGCPRTWDKTIQTLRDVGSRYLAKERIASATLERPESLREITKLAVAMGLEPTKDTLQAIIDNQKSNIDKDRRELLSVITSKIQGHIGKREAGVAFSDYVATRLKYGTDLIAEEIMSTGQLTEASEQKFLNLYKGQSFESKSFGHHLVSSMSENAAIRLTKAIREKNNNEIEVVAERFAKGMMSPATIDGGSKRFAVSLDESEINLGFTMLLNKVNYLAGDSSGIKRTDSGFGVSRDLTERLIKGIGKEPASKLMVPGLEKTTRLEFILGLLTQEKAEASIHIESEELKNLLAQGKEQATQEEVANTLNTLEENRRQEVPSHPDTEEQVITPQQTATKMKEELPDPDSSLMPDDLTFDIKGPESTSSDQLAPDELDFDLDEFDEEFDLPNQGLGR